MKKRHSTLLVFLTLLSLLVSTVVHAQTDGTPAATANPGNSKTQQPEEDDFSETPYTEYGEFSNDDDSESEDTKFFMYGRFFGISLGAGAVGSTGNRSLVYQPFFPAIEIRAHYWFDFNVAIDLGFTNLPYTYTLGANTTDVNIQNFGINIKYYLTTTDLPAAVAFANPYFLGGFGGYSKRETTFGSGTSEAPDTKVGACVGAGLEFALRKRKLYLAFEGKMHFPRFNDSVLSTFSSVGADNLNGQFYSIMSSLLFVW